MTIPTQRTDTPFTNIIENTPTKTIIINNPTPTDLPTQSNLQETLMLQNLLSISCNLPCMLNITPGKTSIVDARLEMDEFGATFIGSNQSDLLEYFYFLHLNYSYLKENSGNKDLYQKISLYSDNNLVERIEFGIDIKNQDSLIQEYWNKYSMNKIISLYGAPDQILFYLDKTNYLPNIYYEILYYYTKSGIEIEMEGISGDNQLCLDINHILGLKMTLTDVSRIKNIFNPYWMQPSDNTYYSSINDILGITEIGFTKLLLANSSDCFNINGQ
jgi:hypothetical protein